ncbi:MAG TPA: hypothetical protein VFF58_00715 [Candidatus Nitrosotalea sp.]|nr:hypothetical protein [Candidatus Nitrosotalea sp.]
MKRRLLLLVLVAQSLAQTANNARMLSGVNSQVGPTYLFAAVDATRLTTFANAGAVAVTLPPGNTAGFGAGTEFDAQNLGPGTVTITCACTIFSANSTGAPTIQLGVGQGVELFSAGVNYVGLASGSGLSSLPFYLNLGTATSQANECASVVQDSLGSAVTAVAALRSIDASNVGHDVACVIATAVTTNEVGEVVFPYISSFSTNAAPSQHQPGSIEVSGTAALRMAFSNTGLANRKNSMLWRSCIGGCGTDWNFAEDVAGVGNEDLSWIGGSGQVNLYATGNCPAGCATTFKNVAGAHQFLLDDGTHSATTNPEFALVNGHLGHGTAASNADNWGTAVCSTNTVTVTFVTAFSNATYQVFLTDQTTAGGARVSTKNVGSFVITCTGASDSVDYEVLGNPY